jgi:Ran GTPase-activating protein (RanGAP) involved in mRNA processing and transport
MPQIEMLNLRGNGMSERGSIKILKRLQMKNVRKINLSDNRLGEQSIEQITRMITTFGNQV